MFMNDQTKLIFIFKKSQQILIDIKCQQFSQYIKI